MIEPRADIALMAGYHSPQLDVDVRLNTNESPVPPPAAFSDAVAAASRIVTWNRYPDRQASELRSRIAQRHGVNTDQVFAANGSNEVLQCLLLAYGGPGRSSLVFEPSYALHTHLSRITGTAVIEGERDADFELNVDEACDLIASTRPAVTFLCSPNNPSGTVATRDSVERLITATETTGGLLCVDEAYGEFAAHSALEFIDDSLPLVVTRTYSKTWSMAAARLGYLIGAAPIVKQLNKVVLPYHLDALKQAVGIAALDYLEDMQSRVAGIIAERERLVERLTAMALDVWPSGANFVLMRPRQLDGDALWHQLVERSVLVRNCASWPRLSGCLRVTIGTRKEDDRLLAALEEILE